jgi:4-amino-4-deoxy-L-arabinose transferase-like glycosyltransferase
MPNAAISASRPWLWSLLGIGICIHLLFSFTIGFSVDEAHYALYARHLDWSYFDHPPLVGWIQWPLVVIHAKEGVIRLIPGVLWIFSALLAYRIANRLTQLNPLLNEGELAGICTLALILLAPMLHILAVGLLPDTLLSTISLGVLYLAVLAIQHGFLSTKQWIFLGVLLGLAGLSKYTAVFILPALLLVFYVTGRFRFLKEVGFYFAGAIALLLIAPVLYWNWQHDWLSFRYQIAHGTGGEWAIRRVAAFLGIQILCFGFLPLLGLWAYFKYRLFSSTKNNIALLCFFLVPFFIFTSLSGGGSLPHWTSPAWYCLAPFAGVGLAQLMKQGRTLLMNCFIALQGLICIVGFGLVFAGGEQLSGAAKSNPIADLYGWEKAAEHANKLVNKNQVAGIAVQNWTLGSRIAWYANPTPVFVLDQRQDQFDFWFGDLPQGANAIVITWSMMTFQLPIGPNGFQDCQPLDRFFVERFGNRISEFKFSVCHTWSGKSAARSN